MNGAELSVQVDYHTIKQRVFYLLDREQQESWTSVHQEQSSEEEQACCIFMAFELQKITKNAWRDYMEEGGTN